MIRSTRIWLPRTSSRGSRKIESVSQRRTYIKKSSAQPATTRASTEAALRKYYKERFGSFRDQDPLVISLYKKVLEQIENRVSSRAKISVRAQIVSPKLCDDVLAYIGPSLEKHKGCDILDLNPGVGLWSSKLHDFLQPRSHILLESAPDHFEDYLNPLVEQPNSTYKLVPGDITEFATFERIIDEGHFPHQKRVSQGQARDPGLNDSLLVTGTLFWDPKLPGKGFDSMSKQLLASFAKMAGNYDLFHALGQARMLFWTPTEDMRYLLPKSQITVGKGSFWHQISVDMAEIVAGGQEARAGGRGTSGREPRYMIESTYRAMQRAKANGIELPAHRREYLHDFADDIGKMSGGTGMMSSEDVSKYLLEQELAGKPTTGLIADQTIESWHLDHSMGIQPKIVRDGGRTRIRGEPKTSKKYNKPCVSVDVPDEEATSLTSVSQKRASALQSEMNRIRADKLVDVGEDIYHLECDILALEDGAEKNDKVKKVEEMQKEFDRRLNSDVQSHLRPTLISILDDRISIRSPVRRLSWDSRPFEPLIMQPHEVWPPNEASLADMTPLPPLRGDDHDHAEYVRDIIYGLFEKPGRPLPQALENMHHGASEIMENVPVLRDPKRGGRLIMDNLRIRMLTVEMVEGLTKAWREWPFRDPDATHSNYFRMKGGSRPLGDFDL
ncbi:S-adenosyl-L-methionine-dependent methyltransferase [Lophiostoma macrostomum CBS 122681]|uniref:Mitochondrial transcription factor 1 n=1 Tax=Lophiostoma macrostomum CBS 122681 TaxID=1314788 RepID=A0A6A6TEQ2_9PLEO|nr:S-adenosyl-L-methionine-dependent methyltransferase [Lophiostoma macrostomum CBS 122681]